MQKLCEAAPGLIWTAIITGLMLLAQWLGEYFGELSWVPPVVGLVTVVIVPVLRVLFEPRDVRSLRQPPRLRRWML